MRVNWSGTIVRNFRNIHFCLAGINNYIYQNTNYGTLPRKIDIKKKNLLFVWNI